MKIKFIIISIFLFINISYSQYGIGKDIIAAKKEMKELLAKKNNKLISDKKSSGFAYNSDSKKYDRKVDYYYTLLFEEEFEVLLNQNKYNNCNLIQMNTNEKDIYENLLQILNFKDWKFDYVSKQNSDIKYYKYKNLKINITENPDASDMKYRIVLVKQ